MVGNIVNEGQPRPTGSTPGSGDWKPLSLARHGGSSSMMSTSSISPTEIRTAVRELCLSFDESYWQRIDAEQAYPEEFVDALTKGGWLASLIPEEYGGAGLTISEGAVIMEEI